MISGDYYNGQTSKRHRGILCVDDRGRISVDVRPGSAIDLTALTISSRIGNAPRVLTWPDGASFETFDHHAIDALMRRYGNAQTNRVHRFESNLWIALSAAIIATSLIVAVAIWGLPWIAGNLAPRIPHSLSETLSKQGIQQLDQLYFKPSQLDATKRKEIRTQFNRITENTTHGRYQILFRDGGFIGANAMALPDGTIIVTDQFVNLTDSDDELLAVLYHEIGHVEHDHSLRNIIEAAGLSVIALLMFGDTHTAVEALIAVPVWVTQAGFSRRKESEADDYALSAMITAGINPDAFATIMEKLAGSRKPVNTDDNMHAAADLDATNTDKANTGDLQTAADNPVLTDKPHTETADTGEAILQYFSTHPLTQERINKFRQAAEALRHD